MTGKHAWRNGEAYGPSLCREGHRGTPSRGDPRQPDLRFGAKSGRANGGQGAEQSWDAFDLLPFDECVAAAEQRL